LPKSEYFSCGFSSRFVHLSFYEIEGDLLFNDISELTYLQENDQHFLLEPGLLLKGQLDRSSLGLQMGYSINLTDSDFRQFDSYVALIFNYSF